MNTSCRCFILRVCVCVSVRMGLHAKVCFDTCLPSVGRTPASLCRFSETTLAVLISLSRSLFLPHSLSLPVSFTMSLSHLSQIKGSSPLQKPASLQPVDRLGTGSQHWSCPRGCLWSRLGHIHRHTHTLTYTSHPSPSSSLHAVMKWPGCDSLLLTSNAFYINEVG